MLASDIIAEVSAPLIGLPVYLAGSLVAEETYGLTSKHDDADIFCSTLNALIAGAQRLQGEGYKLDDRFSRVWARWLKYGTKGWHTNSLKLHSPTGVEVNLVYKLQDGHPTTSLSQVLESFDFGLLGVGYDLEYGLVRRDQRSFLFPGHVHGDPLPLMPNKRTNWRAGFISQYNGIREAGRYAKYVTYGYDLSLVKDDLLCGYQEAAAYLTCMTDRPEKVKLGQIYEVIADRIDLNMIDEILEANKEILYLDSLDEIMEHLE